MNDKNSTVFDESNNPHPSEPKWAYRIDWGHMIADLSDWNDSTVEREMLHCHLRHRYFAPDSSDNVEPFIQDAISLDILDEKENESLEYNGKIRSISLKNGEARLITDMPFKC